MSEKLTSEELREMVGSELARQVEQQDRDAAEVYGDMEERTRTFKRLRETLQENPDAAIAAFQFEEETDS